MLYEKFNGDAFAGFILTLSRLLDLKDYPLISEDSEGRSFVDKYGIDVDHRVVVVGSNPSQASKSLEAFEKGTRSRAAIDSWFQGDDKYFVLFSNIANHKKKGNKPLTKTEIELNLPVNVEYYKFLLAEGFRVVAVGNTAHEALDIVGIPHFKMWHPSGLCRLWNDEKAGKAMIEEMIRWIKN